MKIRPLLPLLCFLLSTLSLQAQNSYEADTRSVDALLSALYDVISGPAGQQRDEARFRNLFLPEAQLCAQVIDTSGKARVVYRSVTGFIEGMNRYTKEHPFFEVEIARRIQTWEGLVHVWSTYEARPAPDQPSFARGINSIQLFHDGTRWYVVNIYWMPEHEGATLPKKYRKS